MVISEIHEIQTMRGTGTRQRMTTPGPPPAAVGFADDGRFLYATTKGPELAVWVR
jgi:hypothetical protein